MILENRVQELRKAKGYTQIDLANISGVTLNTIQKIESTKGKTQEFSISTGIKLARALNCKVEDLFRRKKRFDLKIGIKITKKESRVSNMNTKNYENLIVIDAGDCDERDIILLEEKANEDNDYYLLTKQIYNELKLDVDFYSLYDYLQNEADEIDVDFNMDYVSSISFDMSEAVSLIEDIITSEEDINNLLEVNDWYEYIITEIKKLMFDRWIENAKITVKRELEL